MPRAGDAKNPGTHTCPQCGQPARLDQGNPWRPFCSERCKLLDLGEWFSGSHAIPADSDGDPPPQDDGSRQ
ncbi:MAG: DNA gyrase inhibitor YacG [Stenotrophobium sp.]